MVQNVLVITSLDFSEINLASYEVILLNSGLFHSEFTVPDLKGKLCIVDHAKNSSGLPFPRDLDI